MTLVDEIKANFGPFQEGWQNELKARLIDLPNQLTRFEESYIRLTSLQAWRSHVIEPFLPAASLAFYSEAQNDALISHVQASLGSWRVALKALRSCIENILLCLYYKDHAVEQQLWEAGKFRMSVSGAITYFNNHPLLVDLPDGITGIGLVNQQYGKLSKAVHASSIDFRMTSDGTGMSLWKFDAAHEGRWESHEKKTLQGLNLLMLVLLKEHLQGASLMALRQSLAFVVPKLCDPVIKTTLKVTIKR